MAIDVGSAAIERATSLNGYYTMVDLFNPANAAGVITSVEIWMQSYTSDAKVGTFYLVSGTTYKCRDSQSIGEVNSGSKQTFNNLSISVEAGDFIGLYFSLGAIKMDTSGGTAIISPPAGDYADPGDEAIYGSLPGYAISLYGYSTDPSSSSSSNSSSSHSSSSQSSSHSSSSHSSSSHSSSSHSSSSHSSSSHSSSSHSSSSSSRSSSHSSSSQSSSHSSSSHSSSSHSSSSHSSLSSSHSSSSHSSSSQSSSHSSSSHSSSSHSSSSRTSSHSSSSHSSSSHSSSSHSSSSHSSSSHSSSSSSHEPATILSFPAARADDYDPDLVFDDVTGTWVSDEELLAGNGSRYRGQFVCVGKSLIYYEELT